MFFLNKCSKSKFRRSNPSYLFRLSSKLWRYTWSHRESSTGRHASLFTPPSEDPGVCEEKTEKLRKDGSKRICQPETHSLFSLPRLQGIQTVYNSNYQSLKSQLTFWDFWSTEKQKINCHHQTIKPYNLSHNDARIQKDARPNLLAPYVKTQPAIQPTINSKRSTVIRKDLSHTPTASVIMSFKTFIIHQSIFAFLMSLSQTPTIGKEGASVVVEIWPKSRW